jgi:c(7)-type cytochrome triheme protein
MRKVFSVSSLILVFLFSGNALGRIGGGDIVFTPQKAGEVIFSHEAHVGSVGLKCTDCHDVPYVTKEKHKHVTMTQMQKGQSCGACHNGKKAFDVKAKGNCANCHKK